MERDLADLTKDLDDRFYCLKRESLQELAVILAEWKRQAHLFNNNKSRTVRTQVHGTQHRNITGKMCIPYPYIVVFSKRLFFKVLYVLKPCFLYVLANTLMFPLYLQFLFSTLLLGKMKNCMVLVINFFPPSM
jgi:hypothetical protein